MSVVVIKQIKSSIKKSKNQKLNLEALGLRKINHVVEHKLSPEILGMINAVKHLVKVDKKN